MASLAAAGVPVAAVGSAATRPWEAVGDELQARPGYDRIVLSTFPPGVSRWLKGNLPAILERRFRLPVDHVTSQPRTPSPADGGRHGQAARRRGPAARRRGPDEDRRRTLVVGDRQVPLFCRRGDPAHLVLTVRR